MSEGTQVTYNEIVMRDVLTTMWDESVVYDFAGVDPLYTKITMTFTGLLHSSAIATRTTSPTPGISTGASIIAKDRLDRIRAQMMMPRGDLELKVGNEVMLKASGVAVSQPLNANSLKNRPSSSNQRQDMDVNNGPKPISFQIVNLWGSEVFRVTWTVEVCLQFFCEGESPDVLGNRWAVSESIDSQKYLTKNITGELRLSSYASVPPSGYKYLVVPPLETGFRRESIDYAVSADLTTVRYSVVDKQIEFAAPFPAVSFNLTHNETTHDGITFLSHASSEVVGQPGAVLGDLVRRAIQLVENRLGFSELLKNPASFILHNASITTQQGERIQAKCDISLRLLGSGKSQTVNKLTSDTIQRITTPLTNLPPLSKGQKNLANAGQKNSTDYDPEISYVAPDHGFDSAGKSRSSAAMAVLLAYLQSPCGDHSMPTDGSNRSEPDKKTSQTQTADTGTRVNQNGDFGNNDSGPLSNDKSSYDEEVKKVIYVDCRVTDEWFDDDMKAAMPIADTDADVSMIVLRIAKRYSRRLVTYQASRVGDFPDIPNLPEKYQDCEDNVEMHRVKFARKLIGPTPTPDGGGAVAGVSMTAEYISTKPMDDTKKRAIMRLPILTANTSIPATVVFNNSVNKGIGVEVVEPKKKKGISRSNA